MSLNSTIQALRLQFSAELWWDLVSLYSRQSAPYTHILRISFKSSWFCTFFFFQPVLYITSGWESWNWLYLIKFFHLHFISHKCKHKTSHLDGKNRSPLENTATSSVISDLWDRKHIILLLHFSLQSYKKGPSLCRLTGHQFERQ